MPCENKPVRILLVDDHAIFRSGIKALLEGEPDFAVVGEAADGAQAVQLAGELQPGVVILDLSMPGMSGIETARALKNILPDVLILVLTMYEEESFLLEAFRAGAVGYIVKRTAEAEMIQAMHVVLLGDLYIHPVMARALLRNVLRSQDPAPAPVDCLTAREIEILRLLARGLTNKQVAECLSLSQRTVETHRAHIMSKLNLRSRIDLVTYAEDHGLMG